MWWDKMMHRIDPKYHSDEIARLWAEIHRLANSTPPTPILIPKGMIHPSGLAKQASGSLVHWPDPNLWYRLPLVGSPGIDRLLSFPGRLWNFLFGLDGHAVGIAACVGAAVLIAKAVWT